MVSMLIVRKKMLDDCLYQLKQREYNGHFLHVHMKYRPSTLVIILISYSLLIIIQNSLDS